MKSNRRTFAAIVSILLPILGCAAGYWYGNQINWLRLSSPPAQPAHIVGIGYENSPEGDFAYVIETINGEMYYYHEYGSEHWAEAREERIRWFEEGNQPCGGSTRPFIPPLPGKVAECFEYTGPFAEREPEVYVKQFALLEDGSVWLWSYPRSLVYAVVRRNILFGFLGLLAGGIIAAVMIPYAIGSIISSTVVALVW